MDSTEAPPIVHGRDHRTEILREAATMALYVSVVEIAELGALPQGRTGHGDVAGPTGVELLAIIWGTALGLAIAHWFAFRLAAHGFRGSGPTRLDAQIGLVQLGGAAFVAALSSIPVILFSDVQEQQRIGYVPALIIGVIGYFISRATGKGRLPSFFFGITALSLGIVVALFKTAVSGH